MIQGRVTGPPPWIPAEFEAMMLDDAGQGGDEISMQGLKGPEILKCVMAYVPNGRTTMTTRTSGTQHTIWTEKLLNTISI